MFNIIMKNGQIGVIFEVFPLRENMNHFMRIMLKGSSDA